jgi:hypothetical protein
MTPETRTVRAENLTNDDIIVATFAGPGQSTATLEWPVESVTVGKVHVRVRVPHQEDFTYHRADAVRVIA